MSLLALFLAASFPFFPVVLHYPAIVVSAISFLLSGSLCKFLFSYLSLFATCMFHSLPLFYFCRCSIFYQFSSGENLNFSQQKPKAAPKFPSFIILFFKGLFRVYFWLLKEFPGNGLPHFPSFSTYGLCVQHREKILLFKDRTCPDVLIPF